MELIAPDSQAKAKNLIPAIEELRQRALRLEQSRISDLEGEKWAVGPTSK